MPTGMDVAHNAMALVRRCPLVIRSIIVLLPTTIPK